VGRAVAAKKSMMVSSPRLAAPSVAIRGTFRNLAAEREIAVRRRNIEPGGNQTRLAFGWLVPEFAIWKQEINLPAAACIGSFHWVREHIQQSYCILSCNSSTDLAFRNHHRLCMAASSEKIGARGPVEAGLEELLSRSADTEWIVTIRLSHGPDSRCWARAPRSICTQLTFRSCAFIHAGDQLEMARINIRSPRWRPARQACLPRHLL